MRNLCMFMMMSLCAVGAYAQDEEATTTQSDNTTTTEAVADSSDSTSEAS